MKEMEVAFAKDAIGIRLMDASLKAQKYINENPEECKNVTDGDAEDLIMRFLNATRK